MKKVLTSKRNPKIGKVQTSVLLAIAAAGLFVLNPVAPLGLVALLGDRKDNGRSLFYRNRYAQSALSKLVRSGYVALKKSDRGKQYYVLAEKGKELVSRLKLGEVSIKEPRRWDGKWRVVMFDIKEWRRGDRDMLRRELVNLGLERLQNSVWIHPYDCEDIVALIKTGFGLGSEVIFMLVDKIENDIRLRQRFNLR